MSLVTMRTAIQSTLSTNINKLAKVYTHGGRFDVDELKRWALQAPCAIVSALAVRDLHIESGQPVADLYWGCFIVTKDQVNSPRDVEALLILELALSTISPLQRFGVTEAHAPHDIRADNLFAGKLDQSGVAIWAITWRQGYDINPFDLTNLDDFLRFRADIDLATADDSVDAQDSVDLPAYSEDV